jgi:hypothetical protein
MVPQGTEREGAFLMIHKLGPLVVSQRFHLYLLLSLPITSNTFCLPFDTVHWKGFQLNFFI